MMLLSKYSFGVGDRFARQAEAQLKAFFRAREKGIDITPVWNKSNREHLTIGSLPHETGLAAADAVRRLNWDGPWYVDADHVNMESVDRFTGCSNYFTIDVADYIGQKAEEEAVSDFCRLNDRFTGEITLPGMAEPLKVTREMIRSAGEKFLFAARQAGKIFRHIKSERGNDNFITEISMDEVDSPQSPAELLFILSALAAEKIPLQTIAPKFSGRFNKGVDYQGDVNHFAREFEQDLLVLDLAVKEFGLPANLKLSIHSGSDKFSIYPVVGELIRKHDRGIHIKTAGTTWLEEMIGLALAGGEALSLAKSIYGKAISRFDELCAPYATVIDIDRELLPRPEQVSEWDGEQFAGALRHEPGNPLYNPHMRQLIHVGYKVAAEYGQTFTGMLAGNREVIAEQVTGNIFDRHFSRVFF